ncbi:MAG TPA: phenylalanine--tRNA ligase subunit beta [Phycisphaerae bacterium]|nr:phenylalanine--tRNA ligase subunit beta [Phycisphaerae bacterium]HOJ76073.1 phenylalanine--tRNA ligase subunit beta [Phycisphaerae bacterium]
MFISLNWVRDFVDLPADVDPRELAEQFTIVTAEVEGIEHIQCEAAGLVAAEILSVAPIPGTERMYAVRASLGAAGEVDTVTIAEGLKAGDRVIFAPVGAVLPQVGTVTKRQAAGRTSEGMIVPGDALRLSTVGQRAVWLPPSVAAGSPIDLREFDDWVIEVDNKSITHRPDLWGHYGIARELAAIYGRSLKPYPVVPVKELDDPSLPEIPIVIDDPVKSPRYSALRFTGVRPQPAPLWMQVRLAHVGLRPIDVLVDLTNYIMCELGQPMHAFDGANIDRIEVALAAEGEKFTTLDGVERTMPPGALMIQSNRRSVALAGIMGGLDTEITEKTTNLLLESANFEAATIRKCASALGHRTDASARFEKSQDPLNTVLAIQRFVHLARPELPDMKLTSRLSDCFPNPPQPKTITVDPAFVGRYLGRAITAEEITRILKAIEFGVDRVDGKLHVRVPSFRATKDISIEADIIEEVARFVGYGSIEPVLPEVTVRYAEPDAIGQLERRTLGLLCGGMSYAEVHRYIWFDAGWLSVLGYEPGPTVVLRNPAAAGMERLRTTLVPGLLAAVDLNRHSFSSFDLVEVGSVFDGSVKADQAERRHLGMVLVAPGRKPAQEDALFARLKTDVETWARQVLDASVRYEARQSAAPWEHAVKTAAVLVEGKAVGRLTVVPASCKRRIDEHLMAWSIALAEIDLSAVLGHIDRSREAKKLAPIPVYPRVDVDFSVLAQADRPYAEIEKDLARYDHPLLRRLFFIDSYEGGSVPVGQRSFTFRATLGHAERTLTEQDVQDFRTSFIAHLTGHGLTLRA